MNPRGDFWCAACAAKAAFLPVAVASRVTAFPNVLYTAGWSRENSTPSSRAVRSRFCLHSFSGKKHFMRDTQVLGLYRKHSGATALRDEGGVHPPECF